jgi:hypothetical protein
MARLAQRFAHAAGDAMQPIGPMIERAIARVVHNGPKPSWLDRFVWKLFFSQWERLFAANPRLAREFARASRDWYLLSKGIDPSAPPAPAPREPDTSAQTEGDGESAQHEEPTDAEQSEDPDHAPRMSANKPKAAESRLRPPRQSYTARGENVDSSR